MYRAIETKHRHGEAQERREAIKEELISFTSGRAASAGSTEIEATK